MSLHVTYQDRRDKKALKLEERYHRHKEIGLGMLSLMEGKEKRNVFLL